jgi:hypothetical protein
VPLLFQETVDVKTYFLLHGYDVEIGEPGNKQERTMYNQLQKLDWKVWPSVHLRVNGKAVNQYDAIGICFYQCSFFECKRIRKAASERERMEKREVIRSHLLKLFQMRQDFGGPFGKSYWVFSGSYELSPEQVNRIQACRISLILRSQIGEISQNPLKFGLPRLLDSVAN